MTEYYSDGIPFYQKLNYKCNPDDKACKQPEKKTKIRKFKYD